MKRNPNSRRRSSQALVAGLLLMLTAPPSAHHSFYAEFNGNKKVLLLKVLLLKVLLLKVLLLKSNVKKMKPTDQRASSSSIAFPDGRIRDTGGSSR